MRKKQKRKRDFICSSDKATCAICFDEKEVKELTILNSCDHKYCPTCIKEWVKRENTCPQCKKRITMMDIPGRKRRKRIEHKNLRAEDPEEIPVNQQDHIISMAVMNYVASEQFRRYMARTVLRRGNIRASMLWGIIQRMLPPLNRQIRQSILDDHENIGTMTMDVLDATDAMLRLRQASIASFSTL